MTVPSSGCRNENNQGQQDQGTEGAKPTLADRLLHRAGVEVIEIEADSYRLEEAKELSAVRTKQRRGKKH